MKTFRDLKVWRKAHELVLEIYKTTRDFPKEERYELVAQLRRAASSVPTNIVEGFKRRSTGDKRHFLNMAEGSLEEAKYHLILSSDLGYLKVSDFQRLNTLADEVGKMLYGFRESLD